MAAFQWQVENPPGRHRVIVTKDLPGRRWRDILLGADCRLEVCMSSEVLPPETLRNALGARCTAAIGQLTERWDEALFATLKAAGGRVYSNYAVGYNNVDLNAATRHGIPVGNTPGVLTTTTAEMAVALTFAAARRLGEAERFLRAGRFRGWLPNIFLGERLRHKTVGIIGAGRIGSAYARMMAAGHRMHIVYYSPHLNAQLESWSAAYGAFLQSQDQAPITCRRAPTLEDLLARADVVSIHTVLNDSTRHLIDAARLACMRRDAILVNTSRGPVIDEKALVAHCQSHPDFRAALDVFEDEPHLATGLAQLDNVVIVPHIASATRWTREGMAILAAANVAGILQGHPVWNRPQIDAFLGEAPPAAAPSILNAAELGLPMAQ